MHRINFILVLLHQSWVYYIINTFYNWTCFGVVGNHGGVQPFLTAILAVSDWFYGVPKL